MSTSEVQPSDFRKGESVRIYSWAGPCFRGYVVRINRQTVTVEYAGERREYPFMLHREPCQRCTDHPQTHYPRGYEG